MRKSWNPTSEHDRAAVRKQLERILDSPFFRNSRRYPALLRYVVEKTLSGEVDALKERTLGIEVFHRPPDYDTNADPVVRFSAGEIRRRIAQFYRENGSKSTLEIALPSGSYIPLFSRLGLPGADAVQSDLQEDLTAEELEPISLEPSLHGAVPGIALDPPVLTRPLSSGLLKGAILGAAITALLIVSFWLVQSRISSPAPDSRVNAFWRPLLANPNAVLIEVGRTHFDDKDTPEAPNATIEEHILRPEARLSFSAVQAIAQVAGLLQSQRKQYRIREASSTSLQDLHGVPVVLVSAFNNPWTVRLLKPFRFNFEQRGSQHAIVDRTHPENRDWTIDFDTPYAQQTVDYAIVAHYNDATTGGPIIVAAGIGPNGTQAAGEFVVSSANLSQIARLAPHGSIEENFEAVLRVEVVNGNTGAVTVLSTQFW
jgi:hypothetical protein